MIDNVEGEGVNNCNVFTLIKENKKRPLIGAIKNWPEQNTCAAAAATELVFCFRLTSVLSPCKNVLLVEHFRPLFRLSITMEKLFCLLLLNSNVKVESFV